MLQTYLPDPCCGARLSKSLLSGALDTSESWTCPKCGCEWAPRVAEEWRLWEPRPYMEIIR